MTRGTAADRREPECRTARRSPITCSATRASPGCGISRRRRSKRSSNAVGSSGSAPLRPSWRSRPWPSSYRRSRPTWHRRRQAVLAITGSFFLWAFHKEAALERLTRSLTDERVLTAALTNRLHEVSLLLDAGKQMNAHLELDELLDTILRSACELLDATGGSVMLVEETDLVTVCAIGRDVAVDQRMRLGEGVAGYVALRREPVLIDGQADPDLFPGLADRAPYVESSMSTPLVHRAELQGVLNVNAPIGRSFTEYDLRALAVFTEQAALAIANARLYEAERAHVAALLDLRKHREVG
jgi:putative methionine-R-sulfoxide reductase with GAF domain